LMQTRSAHGVNHACLLLIDLYYCGANFIEVV